jgi:Tol biopolymer transport system component
MALPGFAASAAALTLLFESPGHQHEPRLSPDGRLVAFSWARPGKPWQVYVRPRAGGPPVAVSDGESAARSPSWSPDGKRIAFVRGGRLWTTALGEAPQPAQPVEGADACCGSWSAGADWSPDGASLAYVAGSGTETSVAVIPTKGGTPRLVTTQPGGEWYPRWSPDGRRIAFYATPLDQMTDVWTIGADGADAVRVTDDPAEDFRPAFSPDGHWLAFVSRRGGKNDLWVAPSRGGPARQVSDDHGLILDVHWTRDLVLAGYYGSHPQLYSVDAASGAPTLLTEGDHDHEQPVFASGGATLAMVSNRYSAEKGIVLMDARTRALSPLLTGAALRDAPAWSPDGRRLAYMESPGGYIGDNDLWVSGADGSGRRRLTTGGDVRHPVWAHDGRLIVYAAWRKLWKVDPDAAQPAPVVVEGVPEGLVPTDSLGPEEVAVANGTAIDALSLDTGRRRRLSFPDGAAAARWSPDRRRVGFVKGADLYIASADGRDAKRLTSGLAIQDAPAWSADGRSLVVAADNGEWRLAVVPDLEVRGKP